MPETAEFVRESYRIHERAYDAYSKDGDKAAHAAAWLKPGTINQWRFARMYQLADPLLESCPGASWLTVGDGRYGLDAQYLIAHGGWALATDISDTLLHEARSAGLISEFRKENAESMSFAENSFDFVFCKESYHHFPRPMNALYEMLRVARHAVVLIEPNDQAFVEGAMASASRLLKNAVKRMLRRPTHYHQFESGGNYVYGVSPREMEKVALGMGLQTIALRGINDYYLEGVEFEPALAENALFRKVSRRIARYDLLCRLGINQPGLLAVVLFKQAPGEAIRSALKQRGFRVKDLPRNPYLDTQPGRGA